MEQQMVGANSRKSKKESKNKKKQQPMKVVYITNPMKFTATTSEFRALVQELTGQDANVPKISGRFAAAGCAAAAGAASEGSVHEVGGGAVGEKAATTDPWTSESNEDYGFCGPDIIEDFLGLEGSRLWHDEEFHVDDVFKRLGSM